MGEVLNIFFLKIAFINLFKYLTFISKFSFSSCGKFSSFFFFEKIFKLILEKNASLIIGGTKIKGYLEFNWDLNHSKSE